LYSGFLVVGTSFFIIEVRDLALYNFAESN
jgi:hypothetical protein